MTVTRSASLAPCLECQVQPFDPAPVKESSGIEKDDSKSADDYDHGEIDPAPRLLCRLRVRNAMQRVRNCQSWNRKQRAGDMNGVGFLREDHAGDSRSGE